ncbi:MAG TPA: FAD:protein FMN transferase [Methylomirabilota bacterium]|nr:FAD:protein FMN transferase [Methylomirabilota bacterium]
MNVAPSRRRFIRIVAAATLAELAGPATGVHSEERFTAWRGMAMGTLTRVEIRDPDRAGAERILSAAAQEVARLEDVFTLYRADSALARLNRDGRLDDPPLDLVRLLAESRDFSELTGGAFDVTVQPIWQAYAAHFFAPGADPAGPPANVIRHAADLVDYRAVEIEPAAIRLARPGMGLTLNGIAPGYMTDRIVELLKNEGLEHALVDLGEIRTIGARTNDEPWRAGIRDPLDTQRMAMEIPLTDQALATSGGYGFRFDPAGCFHHIFDPRNGTCPHAYASISILAPTATAADALATGCYLLPIDAVAASLRAAGAARAVVILPTGDRHILTASHGPTSKEA